VGGCLASDGTRGPGRRTRVLEACPIRRSRQTPPSRPTMRKSRAAWILLFWLPEEAQMRHVYAAGLAMLAFACSAVFVANQPRTILLDQAYQAPAVRDAIARSIHRRKMMPQSEAPGELVASATRKSRICLYRLTYSDHDVVIAASVPASAGAPAAPQAKIDQRCLEEADALGKVITREVQRPAQEAAKAEKTRRDHELAVERERRMAQQLQLAGELAAQQAAAAASNSPSEPAPACATPAPAPAAGPTYNYTSTNTVQNSTSNTTVNYKVVNQAPAASPPH